VSSLTYQKSGVNIDKGNLFVKKIKPLIKSTKRTGWVSDIGAFSGLFKPSISSYKEPLIVASTDGVGTKLLLSGRARKYDTLGIDLVAMCANDIVTCGAEPLFFLDYIATGKLSPKVSYEIMKGIAKGCRIANLALIGGETAELPGMYKPGDFDLAGFAVGMVDRKKVINGSKIKPGNVILGLASSGLHSNGYSLVRKIFSGKAMTSKLLHEALKPTEIYVKPVLGAVKRFDINGISHITGGGFYDNVERILPRSSRAIIKKGSWPVLSIFKLIAEKGRIEEREMFRTFNMGIGMALILPKKEAIKAKRYFFHVHNVKSWIIGEIAKGRSGVEIT